MWSRSDVVILCFSSYKQDTGLALLFGSKTELRAFVCSGCNLVDSEKLLRLATGALPDSYGQRAPLESSKHAKAQVTAMKVSPIKTRNSPVQRDL
jgi:hypothetical protein